MSYMEWVYFMSSIVFMLIAAFAIFGYMYTVSTTTKQTFAHHHFVDSRAGDEGED